MYSKWYFQGYLIYILYMTFQFKEELRPRTRLFLSFSIKQSYTERPRLCFPVFSSLSSLLPLVHYICIMYYLVSGTPATYRDVFDILSTPRMTPLTLARSSNLNNWVIDFRALVRRVYLNTISDLDSLVRPHFRWIVYDSIHSVLEYDNYRIQILYLLYKYYPFCLFFYILVPIS